MTASPSTLLRHMPHAVDYDAVPNIRSYATLENLTRALEQQGISEHRHFVCRTMEGRYTAFFTLQGLQERGIPYIEYYADKGYLTVG